MILETIRITSPVSDDNPTGFVVINASNFDPEIHEPYDHESIALLASKPQPGAATSGNSNITADDLERARAEIQSRFDQLNAEREHVEGQAEANRIEAERLAAQAAANQAEAARLTDLAAQTATDMTANDMKARLTERGIEFKSNASKAELKALLDAAQ